MKRLLLAVALISVPVGVVAMTAVSAYADSYQCPEDNSGSYFTGKTRTSVQGHLMKQYRCYSYGHLFWVRA